jgi:hypothetical protein
MSKPKKTEPRRPSVEDVESMDARGGREAPPVANDRLHGADRSGLGDKGWSETPDDLIGNPDDSNIDAELYDPLEAPSQRDLRRAMAGVIRRAQQDADRR